MTSIEAAPPAPLSRSLKAVLAGGLAAGVLDILSAMAMWAPKGAKPIVILQSVAGGLLGRETYQGGASTAALGLALHMGICLVAAGVFVGAATRFPVLARKPFISGPAFGVAMWLAMNFVVVPLSAAPSKGPGAVDTIVIGLLVHMVMFGLPIALAAHHFLKPGNRAAS